MDRLSSELLGFAPDARVLIVNCDDFGMHDAVNAAVVESIESGIVSSCSLMVPCPAAANAMRLLRERPHISFGIHFALIRDKREYRWGPAAAKADVPSLLHPDTNELYVDTPAERTALLATAKLTEVERELRAQINTVVDAGLAPTHLDWHCLADGGRADILDLGVGGTRQGVRPCRPRLARRGSSQGSRTRQTGRRQRLPGQSPSASMTKRQPTSECSATSGPASP